MQDADPASTPDFADGNNMEYVQPSAAPHYHPHHGSDPFDETNSSFTHLDHFRACDAAGPYGANPCLCPLPTHADLGVAWGHQLVANANVPAVTRAPRAALLNFWDHQNQTGQYRERNIDDVRTLHPVEQHELLMAQQAAAAAAAGGAPAAAGGASMTPRMAHEHHLDEMRGLTIIEQRQQFDGASAANAAQTRREQEGLSGMYGDA